ncbi:helix-turn-helix domain-containing protein [Nocardioides antri]|uniref:Helix-turn-helix domain-containing protein n=1 Tax=Nocardioides antri TaxID=2607659 RepID=A0A5B1M933_9ACTN|nr:helix-turn-helix domain-containing protein [Nocardioides antri]KAA1429058.1 helix-turn-helix domain-containing protein [Nocardioides antri]
MLTNVAVLAFEGLAPFELGVLCEGFGIDRTAQGVPAIDFAVCAEDDRPMQTSMGFSIQAAHGLDRVAEADLVAVPAIPRGGIPPESVLQVIRDAYDRGARILSVCSGAFTLGAAGLLDGRECTTHWLYTQELQRRFPLAKVVPEVLYVDAGQIVTSAGTAAGLDACLHIWRQEYGAAVANIVARRAVVPPHRDGGQAQFIARAVPDCDVDTLGPLLTWIVENLGEDHSVESLARRAHMSARTFARRFRDETGTTPHSWVTTQRVAAAEELLETTEQPVEWIASQVGFGNAAALRHHFQRIRGVSPQQYRRTFCPAPAEATA